MTTARPSSKTALRYSVGVQALPATDWQTALARPDQPATAAEISCCSATASDASTLAIAVSQAASPSRALTPRAVSRISGAGRYHAAATA